MKTKNGEKSLQYCRKKDTKSARISILILFCLAVLIMMKQLLSQAYFSCIIQDAFEHTGWAWQFVEALKEGIIYPRWNPLRFWGYGSPFILYPPFAFYLVAFFNVFTGSVITAMNITKFLALFLSGIGMYFLVREFYSEKIALLTASFCIVFPYTIFQFYSIGGFASVVSFIWFSPIILFTYRYIKDRQYKDIFYAGMCYGGLILTHLLNAYMFTFVLIGFILFMCIVTRSLRDILLIPLIVIIGCCISAAYILPVIAEKQFINTKALISEGFNYRYFFVLPDLTGRLPHGSFWPVYYTMYVFLAIIFSILVTLSLLQTVKLRHNKTMENIYAVNIFFLSAAVCTLFLLFGMSRFIWETIPFFQYAQFPSRWLIITTFLVVFSSAALLLPVFKGTKEMKPKLFFFTIFLLCILLDYKFITSSNIFTQQELFPPKPINWNLSLLPATVDINKIDKNSEYIKKALILKGKGEANVIIWRSAVRVIGITAQQPLIVRIKTFYFPGWQAYMDSMKTEIQSEKETQAMLIDVPRGEHKLVIKFTDTPIRYYSKLISLFSFAIMILILLFLEKNR